MPTASQGLQGRVFMDDRQRVEVKLVAHASGQFEYLLRTRPHFPDFGGNQFDYIVCDTLGSNRRDTPVPSLSGKGIDIIGEFDRKREKLLAKVAER